MVAATGPTLNQEVAEACRGHRVVAVSDAYRRLPFADVLYSCDARWWDVHKGCPGFSGDKWSSHGSKTANNKFAAAAAHGLNLVQGRDGDGFSFDPSLIHYGRNSGFQAVNLAGLFNGWSAPIVLVGFDMRQVNGKSHFFGKHPRDLRNTSHYAHWVREMDRAARLLPAGVTILNATPGSAIKCFPSMPLAEALTHVQNAA